MLKLPKLTRPIRRKLTNRREVQIDQQGATLVRTSGNMRVEFTIPWRRFHLKAKPQGRGELTSQQKRHFAWIRQFSLIKGRLPSTHEFREFFALTQAGAYYHLKKLKRLGYITRKNAPRKFQEWNHSWSGSQGYLLGTLASGTLIAPRDDDETQVRIRWHKWLGTAKPCITVTDYDYAHLGVLPGDFLIIDKKRLPSVGELFLSKSGDSMRIAVATGEEQYIRNQGACFAVVLSLVRRIANKQGRQSHTGDFSPPRRSPITPKYPSKQKTPPERPAGQEKPLTNHN